MNVEQYIEQELNVTGIDLMGDEIPIDSTCGHSCKLVIDAARAMCDAIDAGEDIYECDARYSMIGHIVSAFGLKSQEIDDFLDLEKSEGGATIIEFASRVCQCYIFG